MPPDRQLAGRLLRRSAARPRGTSRVGILSTYLPTHCGIASFTASLAGALIGAEPTTQVGVVRVGTDPEPEYDPIVVHNMHGSSAEGRRQTAAVLNTFDVVIVQHEYGIYGGPDGDEVVSVAEQLRVPMVLVAHTVLSQPSAHQKLVLEALVARADAVVAMSHTSRQRLLDCYGVAHSKLYLIPHGAPVEQDVAAGPQRPARPMVLTWGLLGPGKGIEWGIDALAEMSLLRPRPRYVVAGQTHPKVRADAGESYRESLQARAEGLGVSHLLEFEPGYISTTRLRELLRQADVVLLPYDTSDQVTSGVLTEAVAARMPVVSTPFPHAIELLEDGRGGTLVPHGKPAEMAAALIRILIDPEVAAGMAAHNGRLADGVAWPIVAAQYRALCEVLLRRSAVPS